MCSCYGKQYGGSSRILNIELLHDLAISLPGVYTSIFVAALFTIAKMGSWLSVYQQRNG